MSNGYTFVAPLPFGRETPQPIETIQNFRGLWSENGNCIASRAHATRAMVVRSGYDSPSEVAMRVLSSSCLWMRSEWNLSGWKGAIALLAITGMIVDKNKRDKKILVLIDGSTWWWKMSNAEVINE